MEMKSIKIDKQITDYINTPIPDSLKQSRTQGKATLTYITGSTVIDMLNKAFGYAWSWEEKKEWIEKGRDFFNKYANGGEGAYEPQGDIAHVKGTLTVYLETSNGIVEIKKDGYGSKAIIGKQSEQDAIFKAAGTDALKKAASLFGVGLELYRKEEEQQYFDELNYVDPWDDNTKQEYGEQLDYIRNYIDQYDSDMNFINEVAAYVTSNKEKTLTPANIFNVIGYLEGISEEA